MPLPVWGSTVDPAKPRPHVRYPRDLRDRRRTLRLAGNLHALALNVARILLPIGHGLLTLAGRSLRRDKSIGLGPLARPLLARALFTRALLTRTLVTGSLLAGFLIAVAGVLFTRILTIRPRIRFGIRLGIRLGVRLAVGPAVGPGLHGHHAPGRCFRRRRRHRIPSRLGFGRLRRPILLRRIRPRRFGTRRRRPRRLTLRRLGAGRGLALGRIRPRLRLGRIVLRLRRLHRFLTRRERSRLLLPGLRARRHLRGSRRRR